MSEKPNEGVEMNEVASLEAALYPILTRIYDAKLGSDRKKDEQSETSEKQDLRHAIEHLVLSGNLSDAEASIVVWNNNPEPLLLRDEEARKILQDYYSSK